MENNNETNNTSSEKKGMNPLAIIGGLLILLLVGAGLARALQGNTNETPTPTAISNNMNGDNVDEPMGTSMAGMTQPPAAAGVVTINIDAGSFYFSPEEIRVKQGDTVRVVLNSKDMMHNFAIDEFDVESEVISAGNSTTVEFVADQVGEFEYYCDVANHRQQGQVGTLIVE